MSKMAKAKILLVEDDKVQAAVAKDYLESTGYEVMSVRDGKSAIKYGQDPACGPDTA